MNPAEGAHKIGAAAIRPAEAADLWAIRELLTRRDGHAWDEDSTAWFVHGLEPAWCRAWIAYDADRPVAFTNMFLRELETPSGRLAAGYWANLFIDPDYRGQLLYPRLPMAMFAGARALGLDLVYTTVRLRDVSQANVSIGFTRLGDWVVLMKLLRPARLLAKYRGWRPLTGAAAPVDAAFRALRAATRRRVPAEVTLEDTDVRGAAAAELGALLQDAARGRIAQTWSPEALAYRYRQTREGGRYTLVAARRAGRLVAAATYRVARRGAGILAGVVMDALCAAGEEGTLRAALDHAERDLDARGCEVVLFLSGLGPTVDGALRAHGYHDSPERYDLLAWPRAKLAAAPDLGLPEHWRFGFVDHDAF